MAVVRIDTRHCNGCGLCVEFCPQGNLVMSEQLTSRGVHPCEVVEGRVCTGCKLCVLMCPMVAISIYRDEAEKARAL